MWVVVGASTGLGRALATELASRGCDLLLASSDVRDLTPVAADLSLRYGRTVHAVSHDATDPEGLSASLAAARPPGELIDGLLLPIGLTLDGDDGSLPEEDAERLIRVNFLAVVAVVRRFLPDLLAQRKGHIVGFGSVAAVRGRSRNVVYAASKRALESFFESLRHRAEPAGIVVSFWVLGYLATNQSFGQRLRLPVASTSAAARRVCRTLLSASSPSRRRFFPFFWRPLAGIVRSLPWSIFQRLRF